MHEIYDDDLIGDEHEDAEAWQAEQEAYDREMEAEYERLQEARIADHYEMLRQIDEERETARFYQDNPDALYEDAINPPF